MRVQAVCMQEYACVCMCMHVQTVHMLMTIVALFALCWLPLHVFTLTMDFAPQLHEASSMVTAYYAVHWLAMSNSFMNPIIYGFLNDCFRVRCSPYLP